MSRDFGDIYQYLLKVFFIILKQQIKDNVNTKNIYFVNWINYTQLEGHSGNDMKACMVVKNFGMGKEGCKHAASGADDASPNEFYNVFIINECVSIKSRPIKSNYLQLSINTLLII